MVLLAAELAQGLAAVQRLSVELELVQMLEYRRVQLRCDLRLKYQLGFLMMVVAE